MTTVSGTARIESGDVSLGIEFGSTRIKAVLIDPDNEILAVGTHDWESPLVDGVWTYTLEQIRLGLQGTYAALKSAVKDQYGVDLKKIAYMGVSALMHGYLAFDSGGNLLVPFRTYRNTMTGEASERLTAEFGLTVPQRWTISHLYQAILNDEEHVGQVASVTTLAGYVHRLLCGEHVLGIGDASGVFPIDDATRGYDLRCVDSFEKLVAHKGYGWTLLDILPQIKVAGDAAGVLTAEGAALLDPSGALEPGTILCPPEGDAGTGMTATNSVAVSTGNISVGTSVFAMVVLDKPLASAHPEIDPVTTPDGEPVAMVHCINGTGVLDDLIDVLYRAAQVSGAEFSKGKAYDLFYNEALNAAPDASGIVSYNYLAGEHITKLDEGRPLYFWSSDTRLSLGNLMRSSLMSLFASLHLGMDILIKDEGIHIDHFVAHGGIFKTPIVPQRILAAAMNRPIHVGHGASEGGAWGIALLANFLRPEFADLSLADFLKDNVFAQLDQTEMEPSADDVEGFELFIERYRAGLSVEQEAVRALKR